MLLGEVNELDNLFFVKYGLCPNHKWEKRDSGESSTAIWVEKLDVRMYPILAKELDFNEALSTNSLETDHNLYVS